MRFIHIGIHKTGSTYLQRGLFDRCDLAVIGTPSVSERMHDATRLLWSRDHGHLDLGAWRQHFDEIVEEVGADFVDINLGCPVPKVTKKRGGSAWLCYPEDLREMLKVVKSHVKIPLTIKIRTGWDENTKNAPEIIKIAEGEGVAMIAVHGRTRAQGYSGQSDWSFIQELASLSKIPI